MLHFNPKTALGFYKRGHLGLLLCLTTFDQPQKLNEKSIKQGLLLIAIAVTRSVISLFCTRGSCHLGSMGVGQTA